MMVSTKGRYALIVCLDLAQQDPEAYISLREVAQRQNISMKYLESIVAMLNRASRPWRPGCGGGSPPNVRLESRRTEAILSSARKAYIREHRRTIMKLIEMTQVSDELAEMVALSKKNTAVTE